MTPDKKICEQHKCRHKRVCWDSDTPTISAYNCPMQQKRPEASAEESRKHYPPVTGEEFQREEERGKEEKHYRGKKPKYCKESRR